MAGHQMGASVTCLVLEILVDELFDMHDNAHEGDPLLLDSLRDKIILEQVTIVHIRANVACFGLLAPQTLL